MNEWRETWMSFRYLHLIFKAHRGAHDVGSPTADLKCKEVGWAGLAEATLSLWGLCGGEGG